MRTVPFRDVLWGVANKMGLDPQQSNFLENQAIPIGDSIDQWTRRTYDAKDWPEWVVTHAFVPVNHVVPWDASATDLTTDAPLQIGRVIKVYLVDPATTDSPIDTPFTLRDNGIHVGFEHGSSVWIKFIAPPPRYTAVSWRVDTTFQKDDVTYSYTTGQVYRSKSNGNTGHDPAGTFSVPPIPHAIEPAPPAVSPIIETTQEFVPDNLGLAPRPEIMVIKFTGVTPGPDPPSTPDASSLFVIIIVDSNGVSLGSVSHSATGAETLASIISSMATALDTALGGTFVVTADTTAKTVTINNASIFADGEATYTTPSGTASNLTVVVTQAYVPLFSTASGQRQITRVSMTQNSTVPGSVYTLTVTDILSQAHSVEYASQPYDSAAQILAGLIAAADASSDTFWLDVQFGFDPDAATLDIAIKQTFSVDAQAPPPGSAWWELSPFPRALADAVIRGAYADLLKDWGQTDKGALEEQAVPSETGIVENKFSTMPTPPLSGQESPNLSRYKV